MKSCERIDQQHLQVDMCVDCSILGNFSISQAWAGLHFNVITHKVLHSSKIPAEFLYNFFAFFKAFFMNFFNEFGSWPKWLLPPLHFGHLGGVITCYCQIDRNGTVLNMLHMCHIVCAPISEGFICCFSECAIGEGVFFFFSFLWFMVSWHHKCVE